MSHQVPPSVPADLTEPRPIDPAVVDAFDRDGFARVAGVLAPDTVAAFAPVVAEVAERSPQARVPLDQRSVYQRAFVQEVNLWQRFAAIRPLVFSTRLAGLAADLLGVDGVRIYHDQALVKEAHGGRTPWHCDQYYWPLDTDRTVTAWIPLQDVPLEMGPLAFAAGSHRIDLGRHLDISDESETRILRHPRWRDLPVVEEPVPAGDVTFHQGWTFHGARANDTDRVRLVFTVIYVADGAPVAEPVTDGQRFDRQIWLPDSVVGQPVDSWLNPVVWARDGSHEATWAALPAPAPMIGTFAVPGADGRGRDGAPAGPEGG
jgi:ectoine hydroxylase-related dioxygenase (phytanoyl-CoA dioxygenase family)